MIEAGTKEGFMKVMVARQKIWGELWREKLVNQGLVLSYSSMIISKGELIASVGQMNSHWRHQPQSSVSTTVTTFSIKTKAWQTHTLIHKPQLVHFSRSIAGILGNAVPPSIYLYLTARFTVCL